MPDVQILATGTQAAPLDYTLAPGAEIIPKAIRAIFDGSGAAGAFEPCLVVISPAGHEVARVPAASVAAGGSAEVTWAPFLRAATAAAPSTSSLPWFIGKGTANVVSDNFTHTVPLDAIGSGSFTSDASIFSVSGGTLVLSGDGMVIVTAYAQMASGGPAANASGFVWMESWNIWPVWGRAAPFRKEGNSVGFECFPSRAHFVPITGGQSSNCRVQQSSGATLSVDVFVNAVYISTSEAVWN